MLSYTLKKPPRAETRQWLALSFSLSVDFATKPGLGHDALGVSANPFSRRFDDEYWRQDYFRIADDPRGTEWRGPELILWAVRSPECEAGSPFALSAPHRRLMTSSPFPWKSATSG
jgi:hypothetical protein